MSKLAELLARRAELEREISEAQREEKTAAVAQVKSLMSQYGLSLADLGSRSALAGPRRGSMAKVPPKYRDPETGQTWSGRGLQPNWLKQALAGGKSLSDFAI